MIIGISIKNFKAIRNLQILPMDRFHVLVGPNASGKSTFLDALEFVKDCLGNGPLHAVEARVPDFDDLTWMRNKGMIEIEIWLDIGDILNTQQEKLFNYRLVIRKDDKLGVCIHDEILKRYSKELSFSGNLFEFGEKVKPDILLGKRAGVVDFYQRETETYQDSFEFGSDKSALSLTPPDEKRYPCANAIKKLLMQGIRYIQLDNRKMRHPCPATRPSELEQDGSNLARVVGRLMGKSHMGHSGEPEILARWTDHLRYAIPDLKEIGWDKRRSDNAESIVLKYDNGLECPGWLVSDGTSRMLALTLIAFLPPSPGVYLIEEPENGVHPKALEIILRSLSTVPRSQVLLTTHSPFAVQHTGIEPLLCFSFEDSQTKVTAGPKHPLLMEWDGAPDLATIFASGLLG